MLILKKKAEALLIVLSLMTGFSISAFGKVLFEDDFEAETLKKEPSLWDVSPDANLSIDEDPDDPNNKVVAQQGEANGLGVTTPAGWKDQDFWVDYVWEFDWRWDQDGFMGTAHRYQDAGQYLHSSRRQGGGNMGMWMWNGNWNELQVNPWNSQINVWYRIQISDIGNEHIVKGKERDDDTLFEALDAILSVEDKTYKDGTIGLFGPSGGTLLWDNIIVYEPGTDIHAVTPAGKLTTTWGKLKSQ